MPKYVMLKGEVHDEEELVRTEKGQSLLRLARAMRLALYCLCCEEKPPLYLSQKANGDVNVARHPNTGCLHAEACEDYDERSGGRTGDHERLCPFVQQGDRIVANLSIAMSESAGGPLEKDKSAKSRGRTHGTEKQTTQAKVGLHGLYARLVADSRLNVWMGERPDGQGWTNAAGRLERAMEGVWFGDRPLGERVLIPRDSNSKEIERRLDGIRHTRGSTRRHFLLCIGRIIQVDATQIPGFTVVQLECLQTRFWIPHDLWEWARRHRRYSYVNGLLKGGRVDDAMARVIVTAKLEVAEDGRVIVREMSLAVMTRNWIPIDSALDGRVAEDLVRQGRQLRKPLVRREGCPYLPDFELLDTEHEVVPMEVWGMNPDWDLHYEERKAAKILAYPELFDGPLWEWDERTDEDPPPFPLKRRTRR